MADAAAPARKGIKDVFYETRVLLGRDYTLRRFAAEVLGNAVDPVMLGYIEKGKRFPSEALVRRLAVLRKQDPHELLALLWRDRMLHAFGKELRRVLQAPRAVEGVEDGELAVVLSQAIAALPDDGSAIPVAKWRKSFRKNPGRRTEGAQVSDELAKRVQDTLFERKLVELDAGKVRRLGRHYVPQGKEERQALAIEFCTLFAKGLLDKLALPDADTGTYLRNHYLNIDSERLPEFHRRLEQALRALAEEFAADPSARTRFLNILVTATPF
jgi:hypothetical protein